MLGVEKLCDGGQWSMWLMKGLRLNERKEEMERIEKDLGFLGVFNIGVVHAH